MEVLLECKRVKQDYFETFVYEIPEREVDDIVIDYLIDEYNEYVVLMLSYTVEAFFEKYISME